MWILSLLILALVGSLLTNGCDFYKCNSSEVFTGYPKNGEELLKLCRNIENLGNCVIDVRENCDYEGRGATNSEIRHAVSYLGSTCQEETTTFKVISKNLQCMVPVIEIMEERGCIAFLSEESFDIVKAHTLPVFEDYESEHAMCLWSMIDVKCQALTLGHHCGEDVTDAVEEILINMGIHQISACTPEILEDLEVLIEVLEGIILEELELQSEIEKRK